MKNYNPQEIEAKWQKKWAETGLHKNYSRTKKFYALDMFPYPSGAGLHVGHPKGYIATDVVSRFKMLSGYSVLHPMGWDAFGLPAENYAIKNKVHPRKAVQENVATFKKQLEKFGFTYDWNREIDTTDPDYYKWTQWIFLKLLEKGLAYESDEPVNWCPSCKTVLANEDLEGGVCERCGSEVEQKPLRQWVLKMTAYADRLLYDLDTQELDWEDSIIQQQKNWIGRSEGTTVKFEIKISNSDGISNDQLSISKQIANFDDQNQKQFVEVFTTRVDTIFGCTYCVVAPEHVIIEKLKDEISNCADVEKYVAEAQKKTTLQRTDLAKEKTGVKLDGLQVINPFTNEAVPLFVADYVLGGYGTGAVMAVPAHDERDFAFAKKYDLPIKQSVSEHPAVIGELENAYTEDGFLVNSGEYEGLASEQAREKMTAWLEKEGLGQRKVNYKMRDWVFSRQRYWGEPIPVVHCADCGAVGVPESELPVLLPEVEHYEPTGTGEGPLAAIEEWVNTVCPKCGGPAKRETNTMPQWAGSSWYYLRYIDPRNQEKLIDPQLEKQWMPVDLYVGGAEHATRHLLYARFWHKFLYDIGVVSTVEPFKKLVHVGLIQAEDGRKMSKRWNNVINPDDIIAQFGADSMRAYEMFMGPFTQNVSWSTAGVSGVRKFLEKIWRAKEKVGEGASDKKFTSLLHKTIKKVSQDIENFRFNTAISAMMILANSLEKQKQVNRDDYGKMLFLLAPFAPHICEELWEAMGNGQSIFSGAWPKYDAQLAKEEEVEMVVQINGKVRERLMVAADVTEDEIRETALENEKVRAFTQGKEIKKIIFVPGKLINIVVG